MRLFTLSIPNIRFGAFFLAISLLASIGHPANAAGWPTYRADNRRSGVTEESLRMPLSLTWIHQAGHPPQPAWPESSAKRDVFRNVKLSPTVTFDRAFHVSAGRDFLYYASSADDTVYCLDIGSGATRWAFTAEAPVRLAPTVASDRVYVASDDGRVYCLNSSDGELRWKHRVGPAERRLPGNGRMISLWPVRCGLVADNGVVYACAGLFPSQGAWLCALDSQNGKVIWKEKVDISAQGYLIASEDQLFVPTGRTPPHIYRRADGTQVAPFPGGGKQGAGMPQGGGCFAVLSGDQLLHQDGEKGGIQVMDARSRERIVSFPGLHLVTRGPTLYVLDHDRLSARDWKAQDPANKRNLKWEVPCACRYELIMAGNTLFAGGENTVAAYDANDGKQIWSADINGKAYGLAVSGGRLFVSTDHGGILCFGQAGNLEKPETVVGPTVPRPEPPRGEEISEQLHSRAAEAALEAAGVDRGYCVVLGAGTGRLGQEIAARSRLHVVGVESDLSQVTAARKRLRAEGLYGSRMVLHHGDLETLRYQKHFANLIVSEETLLTGGIGASAKEVFRILRPNGGTIVFLASSGLADQKKFEQWGQGVIPGWKVIATKDGNLTGSARRDPLPGAGEWSHLYADSGNSACSNDRVVGSPVEIQWFGRPGPRRMTDRHEKGVGPLFRDGRLFLSGDNYIVGLDAYNGTILWDRELPDSIRLGALKDSGSMAVADDRLYVASGERCLGFEPATGLEKSVFSPPPEISAKRSEWGYVAAVGDFLFGSVTKPNASFRIQDIDTQTLIWRDLQPVVTSDAVFALERHSGKTLWTHTPKDGVVINTTIAVGGGRIYFVESTNPETRTVANGRINLEMLLSKGAGLVALDMETGRTLWTRSAELEELQHIVFLSYARETLVITGTKNVKTDGKTLVRYDLSAHDAATGNPLWKTTQKPVPDHILQGPHGEQVQHSAIVGEIVYNTGFALGLRTGNPIDGWKWQKGDKCGTLTTSAGCAFSRYSSPHMFNLQTGSATALTSITRPGCWVNIVPAGGLVLIPEASSGCTCYYSIQTSIALSPADSAD